MDSASWLQELTRLPLHLWEEAALCAVRLSGILIPVPVMASRLIPLRFRLGILALLVLCLPAASPLLRLGGPADAPAGHAASVGLTAQAAGVLSGPIATLAALSTELLIGVCLGWFALIVLGAVRGAAVLVSDQVGFSLGGVMDPLSSGEDHALRVFHGAFAAFIFLALDMHHAFLRAVARSFEALPPGSLASERALPALERMVYQGGTCLFDVALQLALPLAALLLLVSTIEGILARAIPQLEFLVFGFPFRALVGVGATIVTLPYLASLESALFHGALEEGRGLLRALTG